MGWELPHYLPFQANITLINEFTALWEVPTLNCFEKVAEGFQELINSLIHKIYHIVHRLKRRVIYIPQKRRYDITDVFVFIVIKDLKDGHSMVIVVISHFRQ